MPELKLVELRGVKKSYGPTEVLKRIDLEVADGEFISVRGKSGVGKTTLLKIIGLLEEPDEGVVKLFGGAVSELSDDERSKIRLYKIGFIFQFFNLVPTLTVLENIELPLALMGMSKSERRARAIELLEHFNLKHLSNRFPGSLSGGERQRVAIIRALAKNPKIILADEPTSSLDTENSQMVISLLKELNRERGVTIVLTSTDLYEKLPTSKDYVLKDGYLYELE